MSLSAQLVLAGLAVALLSLPACERHRRTGTPGGQGKGFVPGSPPPHGQQSPRVFKVYVYTDLEDSSKCYADIDVATLWTKTKKNNGQQLHQTVIWYSDDEKDYTIDFRADPKYPDKRGSPFQPPPSQPPNDLFYIPAKGSVPSQDLKPDSTGYYAFAIWSGKNVDQGKPCKDASDPGYRVSP